MDNAKDRHMKGWVTGQGDKRLDDTSGRRQPTGRQYVYLFFIPVCLLHFVGLVAVSE